ncbi:hypothetical protein Asp14428_45610 [Actinoplanes sp. NBRC 14428]|uniref:Uncharacterized protein DUF2786 n=1 Tax=Pseudosporangium ferrugineum TaxID=439699 RepID=A0A2T0S0Z2_9ACTN|nr:DUF2786 domain-containing protein [Pseudosporangium ferrugineum]PRY27042.1 uncharacterized protein DUF2786 [Pseudosporangium ferrugineum]BCJ53086.1 hypothetical protein Asp14428_45610 [Actinoplanes sp. NBRC 14428]
MAEDPLLARVRKLLAKAEDPACTPPEAEAFLTKATELIAKYGIDQALLAGADPALDPVGDRVVTVEPPYSRDKAALLGAVAIALRCKVVHLERSGTARVHLFGHAADLERVELLFTSLLIQAAHGLAAAEVPAYDHPAAFRRSWLAGFTEAVRARLTTAEREAAASAPGAELVLVDRTELVERRRDETYPRLTRLGPRRLAGTGHRDGYSAGRTADLGGARGLHHS